jgi:hypothetical protein
MEISSTTGFANLAWGKVTQARNRMVLVLCGVLGLGLGLAKADNDAARTVKNLDEANGQIHWPEEMTPKKADSFVHNEIFIKAPANVIWSNLVKAKDWPKWYSGVGEQRNSYGTRSITVLMEWASLWNVSCSSRAYVPDHQVVLGDERSDFFP